MALRLVKNFRIECLSWIDAQHWAVPIRLAIFVEEQGVPAHLEIDGADPDCIHAVAFDNDGLAVGTARLTPDGRIGRMAVTPAWRRQGVGSALLQALLAPAAGLGLTEVYLHAQIHACPFYERHGFYGSGGEFLEAGIAHTTMRMRLR